MEQEQNKKPDPSAPRNFTTEELKETFNRMFHKNHNSPMLTDEQKDELEAAREEEMQLLKEWNEAYDKAGGRARAARRAMDKRFGKRGFAIGSYKRGKR